MGVAGGLNNRITPAEYTTVERKMVREGETRLVQAATCDQ